MCLFSVERWIYSNFTEKINLRGSLSLPGRLGLGYAIEEIVSLFYTVLLFVMYRTDPWYGTDPFQQ